MPNNIEHIAGQIVSFLEFVVCHEPKKFWEKRPPKKKPGKGGDTVEFNAAEFNDIEFS